MFVKILLAGADRNPEVRRNAYAQERRAIPVAAWRIARDSCAIETADFGILSSANLAGKARSTAIVFAAARSPVICVRRLTAA
ncbi:MAG: hypothetical protein ACLPTZ_08650 [Beijerinckiaceae bacterium]